MNSFVKKLFIGKPKSFKRPNFKSSINRDPVSSIEVKSDLIVGDEVSNKKYHGGDNRVLHFYPTEHYDFFKNHYKKDIFSPGSIGENITTSGLLESNIHVGDIFEIGSVICQITEPRFPCGVIDMQYEIKGMNKDCLNLGRLGWFAKVIQEGSISIDDQLSLIEVKEPKLSLDSIIKAINEDGPRDILELMIKSPTLSESWKSKASKKLGN